MAMCLKNIVSEVMETLSRVDKYLVAQPHKKTFSSSIKRSVKATHLKHVEKIAFINRTELDLTIFRAFEEELKAKDFKMANMGSFVL